MFRLCLIFGLSLPLFSQFCIANDPDKELAETMNSLLDQADREILNSDYVRRLHRMTDLNRITPLEELYIQILVASGVDPLSLNGFERNISDILKQSFPYFGSELAFYYEKYRLILLPGLCHWSYLHFERLNQWLKKNDLRSKKILYALPNQKFTQKPPLIKKNKWIKKGELKKVPVSAYLLSFGGRWLSHFSWGALNTVVGGLMALGYTVGGFIIDSNFNFNFENGAFAVDSAFHELFQYSQGHRTAYTVGPFYFGKKHYNHHEAGHTYHAAILGPFYLPVAGISAIFAGNPDHLLNNLSGDVINWGNFDEDLKTGIMRMSEKEKMILIKKIPSVVLKPSPGKDGLPTDTVLEILLDRGADIEMIQLLKRLEGEYLDYRPLPLIQYMERISPSRRSMLGRAIKLYFPKQIALSCSWHEDRERKKTIYGGLLQRLETEEPVKDSFWLDMTTSFLTLDQKREIFQRLLNQLRDTKRPLYYREQLQRVIRQWLPELWSCDLVDPREYYLELHTPILQ